MQEKNVLTPQFCLWRFYLHEW